MDALLAGIVEASVQLGTRSPQARRGRARAPLRGSPRRRSSAERRRMAGAARSRRADRARSLRRSSAVIAGSTAAWRSASTGSSGSSAGARSRRAPSPVAGRALSSPRSSARRGTRRAALGKRGRLRAERRRRAARRHVLGRGAGRARPARSQRRRARHRARGARSALGKPPAGRVLVAVVRRGGRAVFRCSDDGRGVDIDAVRRAASRRGVSAGEIGELGADELLQPPAAGRAHDVGARDRDRRVAAIGLDIVRESVARLGGEHLGPDRGGARDDGGVRRSASPSSSLDALLVAAAGVTAAIPARRRARTAPRARGGHRARPREGTRSSTKAEVIPFLPLARALRERRGRPATAATWSAVVVAGGAGLAAFGVDRLARHEECRPPSAARARARRPRRRGRVARRRRASRSSSSTPTALVAAALRRGARPPPRGRAARAGARHRRLADDADARAEHPRVGRIRGRPRDVRRGGAREGAQRRYALFLVDVEMPGMDGFEVRRAHRAPIRRSATSPRSSSPRAARRRIAGAAWTWARAPTSSRASSIRPQLLATIRELVG